jgi:hypothetical protein
MLTFAVAMRRVPCEYGSRRRSCAAEAGRSAVKGVEHEIRHQLARASCSHLSRLRSCARAGAQDLQQRLEDARELYGASFVVRVGDYGGYMVVETDQPADIHYFTSVFAVFQFKVEPVVDVMDAVAVELQAIEYRKKNAP